VGRDSSSGIEACWPEVCFSRGNRMAPSRGPQSGPKKRLRSDPGNMNVNQLSDAKTLQLALPINVTDAATAQGNK